MILSLNDGTSSNESAGIPADYNKLSRLEIIRDNETGFYNITKTAKMIAQLLELEANNQNDEVGKYLPTSQKLEKPYKWCNNESAKELIDECKRRTKLDEVHYELKRGTPKASFFALELFKAFLKLMIDCINISHTVTLSTQ